MSSSVVNSQSSSRSVALYSVCCYLTSSTAHYQLALERMDNMSCIAIDVHDRLSKCLQD